MPASDTQRYYLPLLDRHVALWPGARVLELGYYDPAAAIWAAQRGAGVVALRPTLDQVREVEATARAAGASGLDVRLAVQPEPSERGTFDVALVLAPYFLGNAAVREAFATVAAALRPEGVLFVQVHRRRGGETYVRMAAELFATVELLGMGGGQRRLYRAIGPRASVLAAPAAGTQRPTLEFVVGGLTLHLRTAAGVFGAHRVDPASRLLVETVRLGRRARVLDLGCGSGAIGLALAALHPDAQVTLVDISRPAVEVAGENARLNRLKNVTVLLSDGYSALAGQRFDAIVSNLPAHRGHRADLETAERLIAGAPEHLRAGGAAWFVAGKALPYEHTASRAFRQVQIAAADGRYKVLHCTEPRARAAMAGGRARGRGERPAAQEASGTLLRRVGGVPMS